MDASKDKKEAPKGII